MKVKISYTLDLDDVPQKIQDFLNEAEELLYSKETKDGFKKARIAFTENNFQVGLLELLNKDQLLDLIKKSNISKKKYICRFERQLISKTYPDLYSFLREMKMIGANTPNISYKPHDPGKLRRLLRLAKDEYKNGFISTFEIYYFIILFD